MANMSIYETETRAKAQGFYFATELVMPTYEQFGHVLWSTLEEARAGGELALEQQECTGYRVYKILLTHPFTATFVEESA
jgi:hypothetical protein